MKREASVSYPTDPIAEIRQIREEIAAEHEHDIGKICRAMMLRQKVSRRKYVDRSRVRPGGNPASHHLVTA